MRLSPDSVIFWEYGFVRINATIVFTWGLMLLMTLVAALVTRRLSRGMHRSRWQNVLEFIVIFIEGQMSGAGLARPRRYLGFLGTIFLFVAVASLCAIVPGFDPPTGSLSTTTALALCVFFAVPLYGIREQGLWRFLASYARPTPLMLPFNLLGDLSRTVALAVRLFGNMMSGTMIGGILLVVMPFFFPILLTILGLLTGVIQAYIFFILATVFIAAATSATD